MFHFYLTNRKLPPLDTLWSLENTILTAMRELNNPVPFPKSSVILSGTVTLWPTILPSCVSVLHSPWTLMSGLSPFQALPSALLARWPLPVGELFPLEDLFLLYSWRSPFPWFLLLFAATHTDQVRFSLECCALELQERTLAKEIPVDPLCLEAR